LNFLKYT